MGVSTNDNISALKLGRITSQSIAILQNLKKFFNIQFKIEECHDEVYDESSSEEDEEKKQSDDSDMDDEEGEDEKSENKIHKTDKQEEVEGVKPAFGSSFIYSCIGIGLENFARKLE